MSSHARAPPANMALWAVCALEGGTRARCVPVAVSSPYYLAPLPMHGPSPNNRVVYAHHGCPSTARAQAPPGGAAGGGGTGASRDGDAQLTPCTIFLWSNTFGVDHLPVRVRRPPPRSGRRWRRWCIA